MSESKEVFALIVIDLTEEQITSSKLMGIGMPPIQSHIYGYRTLCFFLVDVDGERWITKKWKGFENISRLASVLPENRVFDCHLHFDKDEMNPLRNLYPSETKGGIHFQ